MHDVEPEALLKVFFAHFTQTLEFVAAGVALAVPAGHGLQPAADLVPRPFVYVPAAQLWHAVEGSPMPVPVPKYPSGQRLHASFAELLNLPAGHSLHAASPSCAANPDGNLEHSPRTVQMILMLLIVDA